MDFCETSSFAIRCYPRIKRWYERKKKRSHAPKAMKALACKLAKAIWHVMQRKDLMKRCSWDDLQRTTANQLWYGRTVEPKGERALRLNNPVV